MKFKITVREPETPELGTWPEFYDEEDVPNLQEAMVFSQELITEYNRTLRVRRGEKRRELLSVEEPTQEEIREYYDG